jgi:hypothetical protein
MPQIASLFTSMTLEDQSFHVSLKKAVTATQRDVGKIQQTLSGLKTGLQAVGGAILTAGFLSAGRTALDYAASLGEVSQQLGVTTRDLQLYRYIGTQVNLTEEEMDKGLQRLTRTIGEAAAGSKKQATAFRELGVAVQDANGRTKTAGEVIPRLATAIAQIESPTLRAKMAYDLFGKSGQQMLPLLEMGEKGIKEFAKRADELGLVMDDALITKADKASDRLAELNKQLEVKWASTVSENADAILTLANALSNLAAAAVQVSAKLPGALSIAAGAAVGGRVAGGPGALVGGLSGLTYALYDRSTNDPYGVKGLSDDDLKKRAKALAGQVRQISDRSFNADESQQMLANAQAIREEIQRRNAEKAAGRARPQPVVLDGELPKPEGGGKKSGGGRSPKPERDRTEEYRQRWASEMRGLFDDELSLQQQLTTDTRERAMIEKERIDRAHIAFVFETERQVREGELTKAQADELKLQYAKNAQLEHAQVNRELDAKLAREELDLAYAANDNQRDLLERDRAGARTSKDRRRIELELLDLEYERMRLALEAVIRDKDASLVEKEIADARLKLLGTLQERDAAQVARDNAGPMDQYLDGIAQSADELNESLERAAVEGLGDLKSGLKDVLLRGENVFDALGNVVDRFVDKLMDLALDQALGSLFGGGFDFFGLFKKGGGGGISGNPFSSGPDPFGLGGLGDAIGLPGLADGGSFRVDGLGGIDRNVLSINGKPRAMVSASERVHVTPANDRGRGPSSLEVVPSKWFDLIVDGKVVSTGGAMMDGRDRRSAIAARQRVDF